MESNLVFQSLGRFGIVASISGSACLGVMLFASDVVFLTFVTPFQSVLRLEFSLFICDLAFLDLLLPSRGTSYFDVALSAFSISHLEVLLLTLDHAQSDPIVPTRFLV